MDNKRFPILAGLALLAIIIAVILLGRRAPEAEGSLVGAPVLSGLNEQVNEVETLRFTRAGGNVLLTVQRGDSGWTVAERDGYAADPAKVRLALLNLGETKLLEPKTANPERYGQLGVEDIEAADATGTLVEITGSGVEHRLIVGNQAASEGTFVRRVGEEQSLLATGNLVPDPEIGPWLQREITDIPSSRIQQIELVQGEGTPLRVYKDAAGDENFTVADIPRGREVSSAFVANGLGSMLSGLSLEDVTRDREDAHGDRVLHRASYRLFDGIVIELQGWQEPETPEGNPGTAYARFSARLDEERARAAVAEALAAEQAAAAAETTEATELAEMQAATGEGDAAVDPTDAAGADAIAESNEAAAGTDDGDQATAEVSAPTIDIGARTNARLAELQAEVDAINARVEGWVYQIPAFKFSNIDKSIEDMLAAQ